MRPALKKELNMADLEARLDELDRKIDRLTDAVQSIAVQKEKIFSLEKRVDALWERYDGMMGPRGLLDDVRNHQASCPRNQVRWMWVVLIPMGLALLGMAIRNVVP
jgi:TolA-binding protein